MATVTLDRADVHNALTDPFADAIIAAFERARDDPRARAVVLRSAADSTFSAGGDLTAHLAHDPLVRKHTDKRRFPTLFSLIRGLGKPVVAAVGGHCLAGGLGLGLALACDLVVAGDGAAFGTPEIDIGLFAFIVVPLLARNVASKHALQLLLLGEPISAAEAHRFGFVNRVVAGDELDDAALDWARRLAGKSPLLLRLGKDAFHRQERLDFEAAQDLMLANLMLAFSSEDMREGIAAFFDRRPAEWSGR